MVPDDDDSSLAGWTVEAVAPAGLRRVAVLLRVPSRRALSRLLILEGRGAEPWTTVGGVSVDCGGHDLGTDLGALFPTAYVACEDGRRASLLATSLGADGVPEPPRAHGLPFEDAIVGLWVLDGWLWVLTAGGDTWRISDDGREVLPPREETPIGSPFIGASVAGRLLMVAEQGLAWVEADGRVSLGPAPDTTSFVEVEEAPGGMWALASSQDSLALWNVWQATVDPEVGGGLAGPVAEAAGTARRSTDAAGGICSLPTNAACTWPAGARPSSTPSPRTARCACTPSIR